GFAIGIFFGYQLALFIASIIILDLGPFAISPLALIIGAAIGIGIPLLAALAPLWTGTRITVREAMSAYGISAGNGRGAMGARLRWISQTTWLGLRSVFRKRGRAALTLLALTLSGAVFLAIQTTSYSVDRTLAQFHTLYNWDISLNLNAPQPLAQIRSELSQVANVSNVEEEDQDGILTRWGDIGVVGYEPNTKVYNYQLMKGRWLNGDEPSSMVISGFVANKTHLTVGDTLTLTLPTNTKTWTIVGIVNDPDAGTGFVGDTFVPIHILEDFNGHPRDEVSSFFVRAQDRSQAAVNALATRLDNQLSAEGLAPSVTTIAQFDQRSQSQFQILYILFYAVAFIVGLVGVLGLANTLTTSVLERRREIGILRSMGATGWRVSRVFWVEGLALAFIAWLIACAIGIPGAMAFLALIGNVLLPINFAFNPVALIAMLVVILVIATLASFGPTFSASRTRVADILRYE
ncbi:MAG TPA: ABC transporter permease, partial [Ktedonobacterales bacterium]|nr:ABC transporter permease [Ktedonobacterales bacterium]